MCPMLAVKDRQPSRGSSLASMDPMGPPRRLTGPLRRQFALRPSFELVTAWMFPMALGYVFAKTPDEVRQQVQRIAESSVSHVADSRP